MLALGPIFDIGSKLIDKIFPDPTQKAQAQQALIKLQQDGELDQIKAGIEEKKVELSAINAEATSSDKWTSRARPSFLYTVYILLLTSIPMGIVYAIHPATAANITTGFQAWLAALPPDIIELFKWVMLGYIGGRSMEKIKGAA